MSTDTDTDTDISYALANDLPDALWAPRTIGACHCCKARVPNVQAVWFVSYHKHKPFDAKRLCQPCAADIKRKVD